jgi:hypothetical protein
MEATHQDIAVRERAYAIWEAEGRPDGRALEHWERAYQEILARLGVIDAPVASPQPKKRRTVKSRIRSAIKSALPA